jgi:hypothetical protein
MERFILCENIRRFRSRLETDADTDPESRNVLRKLLAEEEAKLSTLEGGAADADEAYKPRRSHLGDAVRE